MDDNHIGNPASKVVSDLKEGIAGAVEKASDLAGKAGTTAAEAGNAPDEVIIGDGLCATMAMLWLAGGGVPSMYAKVYAARRVRTWASSMRRSCGR